MKIIASILLFIGLSFAFIDFGGNEEVKTTYQTPDNYEMPDSVKADDKAAHCYASFEKASLNENGDLTILKEQCMVQAICEVNAGSDGRFTGPEMTECNSRAKLTVTEMSRNR